MSDPLYAFVHLPKTGGQSVTAHLGQTIPGFRDLAVNVSIAKASAPDFVETLLARGPALRLLYGHRVTAALIAAFAPRPVRPVVVLREPASYMVSLFNYDQRDAGHVPGAPETEALFETWVHGQRNRQARWLVAMYGGLGFPETVALSAEALDAKARAILDTFWCVGDQADLEGSLQPLFQALGARRPMQVHRNASGVDYPRLITMTETRRAALRAASPVDVGLYRSYAARG